MLGRIALVLAAVARALRLRAGPPLAPVRRALGAAACAAALAPPLTGPAVPAPPADLNMYNANDPAVQAAVAMSKKLPSSLPEALDCLEADDALTSTLGSEFTSSYLKLRRAHWIEYTQQLTPWELATYLDA